MQNYLLIVAFLFATPQLFVSNRKKLMIKEIKVDVKEKRMDFAVMSLLGYNRNLEFMVGSSPW